MSHSIDGREKAAFGSDSSHGRMGSQDDIIADDEISSSTSQVDPEKHDGYYVETAVDLTTKIIAAEDDPDEASFTFRVALLGSGLSIFGSTLQEIFSFKPQSVGVSLVFLTVIAFVLGDFMAFAIPRWGFLRYLNPHPFTKKEHASIAIMASAASVSALATESLAVQDLFYGGYPSKGAGIFVVLSSQIIGFGVAGMMRGTQVHPTRMIWPVALPVNSLLETMHGSNDGTKRKMRFWYIAFLSMFCWEIVPQWIMPLMIGFSVFCLANNHSIVFSNIFGGASANEGLGILSFCFDWTYIAGNGSPLWYPLKTTVNMVLGISICWIVFPTTYYSNHWNAQNFPWMAQQLFNTTSSTPTKFTTYNQSLILNADFTVNEELLNAQGPPALTATYLIYLITTNAGFTAGIVYMLLWHYSDLKDAWAFAHPSNIRRLFSRKTLSFWKRQESCEDRVARVQENPDIDPHYKLMVRNGYQEVPSWWWAAVLITAWVTGIACLYAMKSTLPWWGFLLSTIILWIMSLFFNSLAGLTGFGFNLTPISQMLAGYLFPLHPLANLYFTTYASHGCSQAGLLAKDLRIAQYAHLPPRHTFWLQISGCLIGSAMNFVMMTTIVQNQFDVLRSVQGNSIWSGQSVQQFNTLAVSWSIAPKMYSIGAKYQWVTIAFLLGFVVPVPFYLGAKYTKKGSFLNRAFGYINPCIILWYAGNLFVGINSSLCMFWIIAFTFQGYVRKRHSKWFVDYNYLLSAALDGGAQVMVFVLTFAVAGGSGTARPFPTWWGNPDSSVLNSDRCMVNPANRG
ncbi:unnamed protein product [Zymoseptoria tritici ST99CH_1A5]|uniref:OPT superfamily oligopeptide transporter n=2 Tax=Zymoseptoria tritici TaxID=1047171 RepID=A0A2H1GLY9_ZYMTR|nr:unnamed protein product [Zymoseptoria tritici ST99CH_1E4]SMY25613.1 unnamed protein product [Zymoseptoria tritici ST99CH_1A5]